MEKNLLISTFYGKSAARGVYVFVVYLLSNLFFALEAQAQTPVISSFEPAVARVGTTVTISGSGLLNVSQIYFAGTMTAAPIAAKFNDRITLTVPEGAATGKITLAYSGGTVTSSTDFTVAVPPTITGLSQTSGPATTVITITGTHLEYIQSVNFDGEEGKVTSKYSSINSSTLQVTVPVGATTGQLTVTTVGGSASTDFSVIAPVISSFSPNKGSVGTEVIVQGENFSSSNGALLFKDAVGNYVPATDYAFISTNEVKGRVPEGAVSDAIAVKDQFGQITESKGFFYLAPIISSLDTTQGQVGDFITISGAHFNFIQGVSLNGVSLADYDYFAEDDGSVLYLIIPEGASSGPLTITTSGGSATVPFTVLYAPVATSLSPGKGPIGTTVTISGAYLENIKSITFNGKAAISYKSINANTLQARVPMGAPMGTGSVVITTAGGEDTTLTFTVTDETPLPVELISFNGTASSKGITLTWQTASEKDNAYFELQSSRNPMQEEFSTIEKIASKVTNSQVLTSYETVDRTPAPATVMYYRLKQVDLDGAFEYSKIIAVDTKAGQSTMSKAKAFPNPLRQGHHLSIEVEASRKSRLTVSLCSLTGQKVLEQVVEVEKGRSTVALPMTAKLNRGLYLLSTELDGQVSTMRIIKE